MNEFNPPKRILMGPGPSDVDPRVLSALSAPLVGHLDPAFLGVMDDIQQLLRTVFETGNRLTIPISATGSAGMEAAFVNLVEPGDPVVVCVNGVFGERMSDIVTRCGGKLTRVEAEWGRGLDMEEVRQALRRTRPGILAAVQAETSTGVLTPPSRLREVLTEFPETLLLLDCVTSLGGHPVEIDRHGVDFAYSGTQKCLSCPPGLAPITVSDRGVERIRRRKNKVQSWYLDLTMVEKYWGDDRTYHHTAPVSMNYGLRESLRLVIEEGLQNRFDRHRLNHRALVAGVEAMGLEMLVQPEDRLWVLNTVRVPDGISDAAVRARLLRDFGIEIGGGLGPLKDRIWRVGLMGTSSHANNVLMLLNALERILRQDGFQLAPGSGVEAASAIFDGQ
ncbi:MAG: alanine--glyoxylate aminotransferase family protein [Acidobacteriota bacterium]|nr:alanine--glyoxylate aminotransferase family protein [Acidobacteriota bacterium]MDE2963077.1 alanine--glyoxylate aminotransferase family protein [Acidobacteriota bacterium]